jgi:hypothetical protein
MTNKTCDQEDEERLKIAGWAEILFHCVPPKKLSRCVRKTEKSFGLSLQSNEFCDENLTIEIIDDEELIR